MLPVVDHRSSYRRQPRQDSSAATTIVCSTRGRRHVPHETRNYDACSRTMTLVLLSLLILPVSKVCFHISKSSITRGKICNQKGLILVAFTVLRIVSGVFFPLQRLTKLGARYRLPRFCAYLVGPMIVAMPAFFPMMLVDVCPRTKCGVTVVAVVSCRTLSTSFLRTLCFNACVWSLIRNVSRCSASVRYVCRKEPTEASSVVFRVILLTVWDLTS